MLTKFLINNIFETPVLAPKPKTQGMVIVSDKMKEQVYDAIESLRLATIGEIMPITGRNKTSVANCIKTLKVEGRVKLHSFTKIGRTRITKYKIVR